jgi:acetate kinase
VSAFTALIGWCAYGWSRFVDRILTYFGSYHLKLGGRVDALVFAGGVGEKSVELRAAVVKAADCLGYHIDKGKNEKAGDAAGDVVELGSYGEHGKVLLCKTDEQEEMAKECTMEEEFW